MEPETAHHTPGSLYLEPAGLSIVSKGKLWVIDERHGDLVMLRSCATLGPDTYVHEVHSFEAKDLTWRQLDARKLGAALAAPGNMVRRADEALKAAIVIDRGEVRERAASIAVKAALRELGVDPE